MTNQLRPLAVVVVVLIAACSAISQQKAQTPRADNLEFHNLRVLSPNITHDELISTMRGFARALGVRCNHCHVANPPDAAEEFDFPNDAKPEKRVARTMIRMTRDINADYITKVNTHGQTVGCVTCHRGHTPPDITLATIPERPEGGRRPGTPPPPQQQPEPQPPQPPR